MKKYLILVLCLVLVVFVAIGCNATIPVIQEPNIALEGLGEITQDLAIDIDLKGNIFKEVSGNGITDNDYTFEDNVLTIKSSFLNQLANGSYEFSFVTEKASVKFTIEINRQSEPQLQKPTIQFSEGADVFTLAFDEYLIAEVELFEQDIIEIAINERAISSSEYTIADGALRISHLALQDLSVAVDNTVKVTTAAGSESAVFVTNDVPVIADKEDFIKLPGESVANNSFSNLVIDSLGTLIYKYSLKSGEGILVDHKNGKFSYTPNTVNAGEAVITFTVTDSYGATATKDITLVYKSVNPSAIDTKYYEKNNEDLTFYVNKLGNEPDFEVYFTLIEGNDIGGDDYILNDSDSTITLKHSFLMQLDIGSFTFTVFTTAGAVSFEVIVEDSPEIELISASNVANEDAMEDILYLVNLKGSELEGIYLQEYQLSQEEYTFADNELSIDKDFLSTLEYGQNTFTLKSGIGNVNFTIIFNDMPAIADKDDFIKLPGEAIQNEDFTYLVTNIVGQLSFSYTLDSEFGSLQDNGDGTFSYTPADINARIVVIIFTVQDSYGIVVSKNILLTYKTVNPLVQNQVFSKASTDNLVFSVDKYADEDDFPVNFTELTGNLIAAADYTFNEIQSEVTIYKEYLLDLGLGVHTFILRTTAGQTEFTIQVVDNPKVTLTSENNIVNEGTIQNKAYTVDLKGADFEGLYLLNVALTEVAYSLSDNVLTVYGTYIETLSIGIHTFTFASVCGQTTFDIIYNDVPVIADKDDFIKVPGEVIEDESFANLVTNQLGTLSYSYSKVSGQGNLVDNEDGTFSFDPQGNFVGDVVILFVAQDQYGAFAQKPITLCYKVVNPKIYDADGAKVVDKKDTFEDVVMTVDTFGEEDSSLYYEMLDIELDNQSIGAENYILKTNNNPRYFSVKADYLRGLSVAVHTFTLFTEAGSATFTIEVKDTRPIEVDIDEFSFIKTVSNEDLTVTVTPYNNIVDASSFSIADVTFTEIEHFTYIDNVLTIFASFVDTLSFGTYFVQINEQNMIAITVKEATAPEIDPASKINILEKAAISEDLTVDCSLFGLEQDTIVTDNDGNELNAADYSIATDSIIIKKEYLSSLNYGVTVLKVINSNGQDSFTIKLSDKPTRTTDDQNVTKFTHESINNEAFRVKAVEPWSLAGFQFISISYYDYIEEVSQEDIAKIGTIAESGKVVQGDFGSITINDAGNSFSVTRQNGWFGTIVFEYTASDELGMVSNSIQMDIVYKQHKPTIADKDDKVYNRAAGTNPEHDIVYTITNASGDSDFPIYSITHNDIALVADQDYSVGGKVDNHRYFTIKTTYLYTLDNGIATFILYTNGGREYFSILVVEGLATSQASAEFDKNSLDTVTFVLSGYPNVIEGITSGGVSLAVEDYSYSDLTNELTISNSFLATLPYGECTIKVTNGYGELSLFINVTDSRDATIVNEQEEYSYGSLVGIEFTLVMYDKEFLALYYNEAEVSSANYSYANQTVSISASYIETLCDGEAELLFVIATTSGNLQATVIVTADIQLPEVMPSSKGFEIDNNNDIEYEINLNGNTFDTLSYASSELNAETDYNFNDSINILTIKGDFLTQIYRFGTEDYSFTLKTIENNNKSFNVTFDNPEARILNGGFETGDIYGWNSFQIWKNEPGMTAWTDDRVVNTGYFDQNFSYNRDGDYNLGIYGGSINKDSGQERMGHLRSSNFTLSGSGYISFKLGGGKNSSFAYVSVRRADNNIEVARFGNPRFNHEAPTGNGEAYLFQYYFDLGTVASIGDELYFVISDTSSNEWCVLSADSFYTYYAQAPQDIPSQDMAANIVPAILNISTADNGIKNGNFDNGLDYWSNVNGIFRIDDGFAISNQGGDSATGVLRSSAFTLDDKEYIRFDWAGRLRDDKQVFISVKEVGTNIEVKRFVRRDNLSEKENGDFDNHMLDLSGLDSEKLYYLEFADNVNAGWGVTKIDNIRLVDENEWNNVTSGDRAVAISGLELGFSYQLPY